MCSPKAANANLFALKTCMVLVVNFPCFEDLRRKPVKISSPKDHNDDLLHDFDYENGAIL